MKVETLRELFVEELQDLYSAENQIIEALPKLAKKATSPQLKQALEAHLIETKHQVERLEHILGSIEERHKGKTTCEGMKGLLKEGAQILKASGEPEGIDAGIISAAQRVEHYEISGYGTVRTYAELLGETEAVRLLEATLQEEKAADQKLNSIASMINVEARAA
jgi:ferritin-like metal-binding protein YciE